MDLKFDLKQFNEINNFKSRLNSYIHLSLQSSSGLFYFVLKTAFTEFNFQHKHNESSAGSFTIVGDISHPSSRKL